MIPLITKLIKTNWYSFGNILLLPKSIRNRRVIYTQTTSNLSGGTMKALPKQIHRATHQVFFKMLQVVHILPLVILQISPAINKFVPYLTASKDHTYNTYEENIVNIFTFDDLRRSHGINLRSAPINIFSIVDKFLVRTMMYYVVGLQCFLVPHINHESTLSDKLLRWYIVKKDSETISLQITNIEFLLCTYSFIISEAEAGMGSRLLVSEIIYEDILCPIIFLPSDKCPPTTKLLGVRFLLWPAAKRNMMKKAGTPRFADTNKFLRLV
ncbi:hypothetical protein C0J52_04119 [Blattella germanica]|nr:hypothetical protein C0J52_04119 [Blattella germanica]